MMTGIQLLKEFKQTKSLKWQIMLREKRRSICSPTSRTSAKQSSRDFRKGSDTNCSTCFRETWMELNICAALFIFNIIFIFSCSPCGGAVLAYPEEHQTLQSCCQWTGGTKRSWSWWWRSSNQGPRRYRQEGMNLRRGWSIPLNWSHTGVP